jgi:hypothetical protein
VAPLPPQALPQPAQLDPTQLQITQLQAQLAETQRQLQERVTQEQAPAAPETPNYSFQMPPDLVQGLGSEDDGVRSQALTHLVSSIGQLIHKNLREEIDTRMETVPQTVQSQIRQQAQAKDVFQDFYGSYPQLNNDGLRPIITRVASQLWEAQGRPAYSPQFRDQLAQQVFAVLGQFQQPQAGVVPTPQPVVPAVVPAAVPAPPPGGVSPPVQFGPTTRPAPASSGYNEQDDIMNTLFGPG